RKRQLDLVEEVVDAQVAHLRFQPRPQVEDRLRAARRKLRCLLLGNRRGLARGAAGAEQLLGAYQLHAEELAGEVLEPRVARSRAEEVGGKKRAERPLALAAAQRAQRQLRLLRVVTRDRTARKSARDRVHRVRPRDVERPARGRDSETADPAAAARTLGEGEYANVLRTVEQVRGLRRIF